MKRPAAFLDIDGTLFRSSLLIELVDRLITEGVFPEAAREQYAYERTLWIDRQGTYEAYIDAVVRSFIIHIKGVHYGEFAEIGRDVVREQGRHVYRFTRDYINQLKSEGRFLVAISQSPKTILDEFCEGYGFDKVYGRMYELGPEDRFTGVVLDEHLIENKANIVRRVRERDGVDLSNSIGVGDTEGDIPLLEEVSLPICFNPNQALYTHARRRGWKVVVERKDVIYEL